MGHWTPTGIEPMDYDDDDDETTTLFILYRSVPLTDWINVRLRVVHKTVVKIPLYVFGPS